MSISRRAKSDAIDKTVSPVSICCLLRRIINRSVRLRTQWSCLTVCARFSCLPEFDLLFVLDVWRRPVLWQELLQQELDAPGERLRPLHGWRWLSLHLIGPRHIKCSSYTAYGALIIPERYQSLTREVDCETIRFLWSTRMKNTAAWQSSWVLRCLWSRQSIHVFDQFITLIQINCCCTTS